MKNLLILGAKSEMAVAIAREYAKNGYNLTLAGRNSSELKSLANDITTRCQKVVDCVELDILATDTHQAIYEGLAQKPDGVICAIGYMGEQKQNEKDFAECEQVINANFTGIVSFLNIVANDYEEQQRGFIVAISSVAGDRGRKANYIYGAAKAGLTAYLSGLRNRLAEFEVPVLTVKPGFVATRMTEGMDLPEKLTAQPSEVAKSVYNAQQKGKDVIYCKWIWRYIMFVIKNIPEFIFKKLSI